MRVRPWLVPVFVVAAAFGFFYPAGMVTANDAFELATRMAAEDPTLTEEARSRRHQPHPAPPDVPQPQHPRLSTKETTDVGQPLGLREHLTNDWFGLRPKLDDRGIVFESSLTADWSVNLRGGASTDGSAFRHLFNFGLTFDTERLFDWRGGTVFLNFQSQNGENGSDDVGDIQGYSNIDADGRTQLSELWFEQVFFSGMLRLKLGKVDANSEFACAEHSAEFLNSSMGFTPTILSFPTYPDPAASVNVFLNPIEPLHLGLGLYDGALQEGITTGSRGPRTFYGDPSDLFAIGEVAYSWVFLPEMLVGRLAVGFWRHTGSFDRFDGTTQSGATGFYAVLDHQVWRENPASSDDPQGLGAFVVYGYAEPDISPIEHHVGLGLAWTGPIPMRDEDVIGIGASCVEFSGDPAAGFSDNAETAVEFFYKIQVFPYLSIKPDLQYIVNPGGVGLGDALVATVRVNVDF
jgi:porin